MNLRRSSKYWLAYKNLLEKGGISTEQTARLNARKPIGMRLMASTYSDQSALLEIEAIAIGVLLRKSINNTNNVEEILRNKDRLLFEIGLQFIEAVENLDVKRVEEIATSGFNVNFVHPVFRDAAIHRVAQTRSRNLLRAFLKAQDINFLLKDSFGRLPSTIAEARHTDKVIQRFLQTKERQQAIAQGLDWEAYRQPH